MTLSSGTRLGPYEIVAPLGAGGMGEVWRARDTRLHRDVAIKVLPAELALDPERLARFEREAHLLAALNHPRIAGIYGLEESGSTKALVLELVEGSTLADLMAQGPMGLEEALPIAGQIAEALEAAHERGIVHRDLKPANVKVTPAGEVKVLDFGLAKARDPQSTADAAHSPTITAMATRQGVILGTAAYMSPEQARGGAVDKRSDLWSFGVLVWELVTGARLFQGETVSDTLAAVLRADLDWSTLPAGSPPALRRLLRRCLERDPRRRLRDAGDAREEIEEAVRELRQGPTALPVAVRRRALPLWAVAAVALAGLAAGWLAARAGLQRGADSGAGRPRPILRAEVSLPPDVRLYGWATPVIALSPDGRTLAYVGWKTGSGYELYVHRLDTGETRVAPNSHTAEGPFFSPDGRSVAFAVGTSIPSAGAGGGPELRKYSLETGLTQSLCAVKDYFGGAWGDDGTILFVGHGSAGLMRVSAGGGNAEPAMASVLVGGGEQQRRFAWPQLLPGGERVLVTDWSTDGDYAPAILDLKTREFLPLDLAADFCRYAATGHLVCLRQDGSLVAVGFDAAQRALRGAPVALMSDVSVSGNVGAVLAFSDDGTLAYTTGYVRNSLKELFRIVRVRPDGPSELLPIAPAEFSRTVRLSPDRNRLAVTTWDGSVWVYDLRRGSHVRVARQRSADHPAWSPDGRYLAYGYEGANGWRIDRVPADGSQPSESIVDLPNREAWVAAYLADGRLLFSSDSGGQPEIWATAGDSKKPPTKVVAAASPTAFVLYAAPSPDGRWLAYASNETGRSEIYVRSLASGAAVPASVGGGTLPRWSLDGRELYYVNDDRIFAVSVSESDPLHIGPAEELAAVSELRSYDVLGPREFIALQRQPDSGIQTRIRLVVNWFEELRRLAPTPGDAT